MFFKASSGRGGIGGAGESPQRRMEKPHGTQREHHIGVLQIIIMVRWGNHRTGHDKGDSLSMFGDPRLDRIQLEEQSLWERIAQTTSAKRLPSVLSFTGGREFARSVGKSMARKLGRRELIALEGQGAASGPCGAKSET